jgi:hypothetical protein
MTPAAPEYTVDSEETTIEYVGVNGGTGSVTGHRVRIAAYPWLEAIATERDGQCYLTEIYSGGTLFYSADSVDNLVALLCAVLDGKPDPRQFLYERACAVFKKHLRGLRK